MAGDGRVLSPRRIPISYAPFAPHLPAAAPHACIGPLRGPPKLETSRGLWDTAPDFSLALPLAPSRIAQLLAGSEAHGWGSGGERLGVGRRRHLSATTQAPGGTISRQEGQAEDIPSGPGPKMLIERVPLGIVTSWAGTSGYSWNVAAEHIFGWTAAEVFGQPLPIVPEVQQEEYRTLITADLQGAARRGGDPPAPEGRRPGGRQPWTVPLRNDAGEVVGSIGLFADITRRKRGEHRLIERTRQLDAVRAVMAEIARELDLATLLQLIIRRAAELVGADTGEVWLWDATEQVLWGSRHGMASKGNTSSVRPWGRGSQVGWPSDAASWSTSTSTGRTPSPRTV